MAAEYTNGRLAIPALAGIANALRETRSETHCITASYNNMRLSFLLNHQ